MKKIYWHQYNSKSIVKRIMCKFSQQMALSIKQLPLSQSAIRGCPSVRSRCSTIWNLSLFVRGSISSGKKTYHWIFLLVNTEAGEDMAQQQVTCSLPHKTCPGGNLTVWKMAQSSMPTYRTDHIYPRMLSYGQHDKNLHDKNQHIPHGETWWITCNHNCLFPHLIHRNQLSSASSSG